MVVLSVLALPACGGDPALKPDQALREELGLTDRDEVHLVTVSGSEAETAVPSEILVRPGQWVQFVTADHRVHVVSFETDSLDANQAEFLRRTAQESSPPLVNAGSRFVVSFRGAPAGRYPYTLHGNGPPGRGVELVQQEAGRGSG